MDRRAADESDYYGGGEIMLAVAFAILYAAHAPIIVYIEIGIVWCITASYNFHIHMDK